MKRVPLTPGSKEDVMLAARLVVEGVIPEATMRAVLAKQKELVERNHPLEVGEICRRKGWVSESELVWMQDPIRPPKDLLPGLELGTMLGEGGMSRVYAGRDAKTATAVAIKILHPRLRRDETSLRDFRTEAERLMGLEHENIVKGYYLHAHDELHYLVMELVDGKSVLEHLERAGRFDEDASLYIVLQIARALAHLHSKGFVHRDVKPANILIDRQNTVKLCDLGLAVGSGGGDSEVTAGTAEYLAPEQARGKGDLDVRSDIYSLGVTLFQLVVGKLPFAGETSREVITARLLDELRSPELKKLGISPHVHYFIQKMMALDRELRYQSPAELIEDIEEQMRGKKSLVAERGKVVARDLELRKPFSAAPAVVRPGTGSSGKTRRPTR